MIRFLIRRIVGAIVVLLVISLVTFWLFEAVPKFFGSDPAVLYAGRSPSPATIAAVSKKLGLDQPFWEQYWHFVKGIVAGRTFGTGQTAQVCHAPCLGYSFINNEPVWSEIISDLPVDISLTIGAAILWLVSGVSTGVLSALRRGSIFDRGAMGIALAGVSLPIYFTGLLALSIFSFGPHYLQWFPNPHFVGFTDNPIQWARNLVLPWVCLAFLYAALYARLTRATMLETMSEDYIRTARAKGLPERKVITRHGLRAALTPIVTIFGLDVGLLLGSAVLTEQVFGYVGIGKLAIISIATRDLPVVLGVTLFAAFFVVVANIIVDVVYAYVDPRVTYS
ncbi:MAG: ABC transporter permease [Frankiaceae bacterium]|nr:ABC transporter permease [Frankiaceae bacterium]MBV9869479.1 ABC transporter permease [Frankiaceae bacterium]